MLPEVGMAPTGYVVLQHAIRLDRPTLAYGKWAARIPASYAEYVLGQATTVVQPGEDPSCLASLRHIRSLLPLAQEARKPIFRLKPAGGALGSHLQAALAAGGELEALARKIAARVGVRIRGSPAGGGDAA